MKHLYLLILLAILVASPIKNSFADEPEFSATDTMGAAMGEASQCLPDEDSLSASKTITRKVDSVICNVLSCKIRMGEIEGLATLSNDNSKGPQKFFGVICPEDFSKFNLDAVKKSLPDQTVIISGQMSESDGELLIYIRSPLDIHIVKKPHVAHGHPPS